MSMPDFRLEGKVVLVTGASRGIGRMVAETFAASGARVVLASRKQAGLDEVTAAIRAAGGEALPYAAHTGDPQAVADLVAQAEAAYGGVDILVNNAATNPHFGAILTAEDSHWQKMFEVNLLGYFHLVKACLPGMQRRGGGKIIQVASVAGLQPQTGMGLYGVTKAGVVMLTRVLAVELAPFNIQVNAVAPGVIKTRFSQVLWETPPIYEHVKTLIPQGRIAEPEELAGIFLYLASAASSFTTGAVFVVDGGQTAG